MVRQADQLPIEVDPSDRLRVEHLSRSVVGLVVEDLNEGVEEYCAVNTGRRLALRLRDRGIRLEGPETLAKLRGLYTSLWHMINARPSRRARQ